MLFVMHGIHMFDRNMWLANCLYCIKRWVIWQYASGYLDCSIFPLLYIILSTAISIKSTVAWLYCTHMLYVISLLLHWVQGTVLIIKISYNYLQWYNRLISHLKNLSWRYLIKDVVLTLTPTIVLVLTLYCIHNKEE